VTSTAKQTPKFELLIDGSPAPPEIVEAVITISVRLDLDLQDAIELQLSNKDLTWGESDTFAEGKKLGVKLGYVETQTSLVATCEIVRREFSFPERGPAVVTIVAYDKRHSLKRGEQTRAWKNVKDSDIVTQLCQNAGFTPDVDDTQVSHPYMFQPAMSDLAFILERGRRLGYVVHVDPEGKTLSFKQWKPSGSSVAELDWGETLFSFRPRFTTSHQFSTVSVRGWDPIKKTAVTAQADKSDSPTLGAAKLGIAMAETGFGSRAELLVQFPVTDPTEAKEIATAYLSSASTTYARADGSCQGEPTILPGVVIKLGGVGVRASGDYVISSVTQHYDSRGYTTFFECLRPGVVEPPPPPPPPPPPTTPTPPASGAVAMTLSRPGTVIMSMGLGPESAKKCGDSFTLTSDDGSVNVTKTISSDMADSDTTDSRVELTFPNLDTSKTYTLKVVEAATGETYNIFEGLAYDAIAGYSASSGGDADSSDAPPDGSSGSADNVNVFSTFDGTDLTQLLGSAPQDAGSAGTTPGSAGTTPDAPGGDSGSSGTSTTVPDGS
jgi:phage protein D